MQNGASALGTIVGSVNNGVDNETLYNPAESIATLHPLSGYTSSGANGIQCSDKYAFASAVFFEASVLTGPFSLFGPDLTQAP